ncbi:protein artichoke-like [Mytilus californianus]|uniref:protein artichoke-like n=1 Tax=Mytilus californianus TaxID=6549 RepID=UPI002245F7FF|nr:protein artichoke-like [Mytilus californianus]
MLIFRCIILCSVVFSSTWSCPDLDPCSCSSKPVLTIDCSDRKMFFHGQDNYNNFSKLQGLYIHELNLRNTNSILPPQIFVDLQIHKLDISENKNIENYKNILEIIDDSLEELNLKTASFLSQSVLKNLGRFKNLTFLSLEGNMLNMTILGDTFSNFHHLQNLDLSDNTLNYQMNSNPFDGLESLQVLHLKSTKISLDNTNSLCFLKNLTSLNVLNIDRNNGAGEIKVVPLFKGNNMFSLKRLSLCSNKIALFEHTAFQGIEQLEILDLSENLLRTVPLSVTSILFNLTHLNLSSNKIQYLSERTFTNLTKLQYLNLQRNKINSFPRYAFLGLGNSLQTLDLSSNKLIGGYFWVIGLMDLHSLLNLNISYNFIKHIQNDSFDTTAYLQVLDISGNPLIFTDTMFSGIEASLKKLFVKSVGMEHVPLIPLQTISELDDLDLSNNRLESLHSMFLTGVKAKHIYLQNMNISEISKLAFTGIKGPISIFLDDNNISSLRFLEESVSCFFSEISLRNNPIICDCTAFSISASGRHGHVIGKCINDDFVGKSINMISSVDKNLCEDLEVNSGWCSKTGKFISNIASLNNGYHAVLYLLLMYSTFILIS